MRARVQNGRWILDDPTGLPEGTEVEILTRPAPPKASLDVYVDEKIRQYVHALLVAARGGQADEDDLVERAKTAAVQAGRRYVTPEDVKTAAPDVLRRFVVSPPGRDVSPDEVIRALLAATEVP